ncbi:putative glycerol-3-phosphate 1-O-acyltransferase [Lupinus albus]|uniref:Putative glycerol-3-phosphate 1-O-acyltransferase n=1 Tax=Lupinus albus TaxID=3870 RepID=A0A6A4QEA3_LUPAL|nr:putative glycerol-3-phosphate 1-O-acyltransferase [Lupinus albus]
MAKMFRAFFFKSLFFFWYRFLFRQLKNLIGFHRSVSNNSHALATQFKYQKFPSLLNRSDLSDHTLIFDVENALLKSSSLFPYFMLVAFEAGGLLRAFVFVLLYPFVCLAGEKMGLKIMIMTCFFGIKEDSFRVGRSVLPKFFLEDVGSEMFEVLNRGGKKVGVTNLPRIMVESFVKEYLEIDFVIGSELKVFCGYHIGLMDDRKTMHALEQVQEGKGSSHMIGITSFNKILHHHQLFSNCKEVYLVSEGDKRMWQALPKELYPKPLIFHDGRLALRPDPMDSLAMLMWLPYAIILAIIRISLALSLPYNISTPLLIFTGIRFTTSIPKTKTSHKAKPNGHLYVCNHRTLLDPLYISFALQKNLIAVTYSLSRMSEILAPIKTVRLTRNRDHDAEMMQQLLKQGDLVVCPEGTTCREPYLLRFSPLFSEMCDEITPVAMNSHVSMFHGTTAGGLKCLDPVFFLMNPAPVYTVQLLDQLTPSCQQIQINNVDVQEKEASRFDVANDVQTQIGNAVGFECTKLTRKDKYLILAGNEGIVSTRKSGKS